MCNFMCMHAFLQHTRSTHDHVHQHATVSDRIAKCHRGPREVASCRCETILRICTRFSRREPNHIPVGMKGRQVSSTRTHVNQEVHMCKFMRACRGGGDSAARVARRGAGAIGCVRSADRRSGWQRLSNGLQDSFGTWGVGGLGGLQVAADFVSSLGVWQRHHLHTSTR